MFTGIITDIATIDSIAPRDQGVRLRLRSAYDSTSIDIGASIACAGICLTVIARGKDEQGHWFDVEAWEEALRLTTASSWQVGARINTERAMRLGDEVGGHLVSGHVDGIAKIITVKSEGDATRFTLEAPQELAQFIAPKGSVTLDGTSLTVNAVNYTQFDVLLIDHSLKVTTWGARNEGDAVNLEIDQLARYVARLAQFTKEA